MDRLRSPGGCPWDAEQTHASLAPYVVEEAHELAEAIDSGDREHLREELGDVLLQVVFHARVGQEDPADAFDIDDVAAGLIAKLKRRHPHVFADATVSGAADVEVSWEAIKAAEKPERAGILDGVPASLPALATATKLYTRLRRRDRLDLWPGSPTPAVDRAAGLAADPAAEPATDPAVDPAAALLAAVRACTEQGLDAEQLLRSATRGIAERADRSAR